MLKTHPGVDGAPMALVELTPATLLLVFSIVLMAGFAGQWLFRKTRVPDTLLLILLGAIIARIFGIDADPFMDVMPFVGVLALITILFDGGLALRFQDLARGLPRASVLAISGFVLSVLVTMLYGVVALDLTWLKAAMLGSIVGGTSAVVILPMVEGLDMGKKAETLIGLESALTDVLAVVVTLALAASIAGAALTDAGGPDTPLGDNNTTETLVVMQQAGGPTGLDIAASLAASFTVALVMGVVAGIAWLAILQRIRRTGSEYVWTMTALFGLYGLVELLRGSGPVAVLVFGIMLGNADKVTRLFTLPRRRMSQTMLRMNEELVFFVRSFFFVFLGLVLDPSFLQFKPWLSSPLLKALGLFLVLVLARIAAVWLATLGDKSLVTNRARFVMLMPRGLAAAVLAAIPAAAPYNIEGIESFVSYGFAILLFTNLSATFAGFIDPSHFKWTGKPPWAGGRLLGRRYAKEAEEEAEEDEEATR